LEDTVRKFAVALCVVVIFALPCLAQDNEPQSRIVFHTTADISDNWFVTNWTIGNIKAENPNNINLFPGIGYRHGNQWFEAMIQRQWSRPGNSWAIDLRYGVDLSSRMFLYVESAPLLSIAGEYEFVFVDVQTWKRLSIGAETENVHKVSTDSLGAGPRISLPIASLGESKLTLGGVYQFRRNEANVPRLYVVLNRRFKK